MLIFSEFCEENSLDKTLNESYIYLMAFIAKDMQEHLSTQEGKDD